MAEKSERLLLVNHHQRIIIGYYEVSDDEAVYIKNDDDDRWPWKVHVECHSGKYSQEWWKYDMKTQELVSEFLQENPDKYITAKE